ncbi:hypothetical protein BS47DRAFT_1295295 [Hydnum rufescens UP504]|uniref:G domain-containing protein n=1 Tax=Hydnum rufescens UP504 TaxID=1448309 RepID=A0A9P6AYH5_9AGAM|nr:hypothetical protein BS47DRAFT_1295295 [Hydnum rufescens UP504]
MWKSIRKHFKPNNTNQRFRVLVLGPANAGKTTLLERLTDSPAGAAIVSRNGKRVITTDIRTRGIQNIDDEITYVSSPDFVFHDSGGFEAGGVKEVEAAWQFIRKRSLASPSQQLQAIWCVHLCRFTCHHTLTHQLLQALHSNR